MSFQVTVTPIVQEVEVNASVTPYEVDINVVDGQDLTLTTIGTSGAATYNPFTGLLNIPQYSTDLSGVVPTSRTLTINGTSFDLSANRTWTIPTHDAVTIGTANGLSLAGQVLSLGLASAGVTGALSGTDWTTFNNKQNALTNPVTGTGTSGQVSFWNGTTTQTGSNNLFWDNVNNRLGIGKTTPRSQVDIYESVDNSLVGVHNYNGGLRISNETTAVGAYSALKFGSRYGASAAFEDGTYIQSIVNGNNNNILAFGQYYDGSTTVEGFRLSSSNLLIGTTTNAGFRLDVNGTTRLNGLQTFVGSTASDTAPLGAELTTTGTGNNWTGTNFATGYTHVVGSTDPLTTTLNAVNLTYYQITWVITGRTAGSVTISFGGFSLSSITSSGNRGPRATSTDSLIITPTSDFNGTITVSVKVISTASATTTFQSSNGTVVNEIRANNINTNIFIGRQSGQRNTTGVNNTFVGATSGVNNTSGTSNSFFGISSGESNTIGNQNCFFGERVGAGNISGSGNSFIGFTAGRSNTTGSNNNFIGNSVGALNTTGSSNIFIGTNTGGQNTTGSFNTYVGDQAGFSINASNNVFIGRRVSLNQNSGDNNVFLGLSAANLIASGSNLTSASESVFIGRNTRANSNGESNQIVIGDSAIGLGSNTTVIGNSSTTFGRWWGSLLIGTSTNVASSALTVESTTQGFLPPRMTTAQRDLIATPAAGLIVYNTSTNKHQGYDGTTWNDLY